MKLYRVLIVDDEEEIRYGVINSIDWNKYGFEIIGDAENGKDALEKVEILKPDIIFTDIKMPFMNGLDFSLHVKEIMPWVKIIVFSGSDDFEFTKKAININVFDYILKPIDVDELKLILQKLKEHIDLEYENKKNLEQLYKSYNDSLPILKSQFLIQLIEDIKSDKEFVTYGDSIGIKFQENLFNVSLFDIDKNVNNKRLLNISLKKIIKDQAGNRFNIKTFIYLNRLVVVIDFKKIDEIYEIVKFSNEICIISNRILDINVCAGVGKVVESIDKLKYSYDSARDALHYKNIIGVGQAIYIDDVERNRQVITINFSESDERDIKNAIKLKSEKEICNIIERIFKEIPTGASIEQYNILLMEFITMFLKIVHSQNILLAENIYLKRIENFTSLEEAKKWIYDIANNINNQIKNKRISSTYTIVEEAKMYVEKNFSNSDLSVDMICKILHVSPPYFSTVFKKETSISFVNYLTRLRLEKALELLKTTDYKTYIIAEKVGYTEPNYFSYVFKKEFGISPIKYKNSKLR